MEGGGYKVKRLFVGRASGSACSAIASAPSTGWLWRARRAVIVEGKARVSRPGGRWMSRAGAWHRIENPGRRPVVIIEVQHGPYLGEDDIIRISDDYGRVRHPVRRPIRGHLLRWRPRQRAQRRETTPRPLPSGAASQLPPSRPPDVLPSRNKRASVSCRAFCGLDVRETLAPPSRPPWPRSAAPRKRFSALRRRVMAGYLRRGEMPR